MNESIWVWLFLILMMVISIVASGVGAYKLTGWLLSRNGTRRTETASR